MRLHACVMLTTASLLVGLVADRDLGAQTFSLAPGSPTAPVPGEPCGAPF